MSSRNARRRNQQRSSQQQRPSFDASDKESYGTMDEVHVHYDCDDKHCSPAPISISKSQQAVYISVPSKCPTCKVGKARELIINQSALKVECPHCKQNEENGTKCEAENENGCYQAMLPLGLFIHLLKQ